MKGLILAGLAVVEGEVEDISRSAYERLSARLSQYLGFLAIEVKQMLHVHSTAIV